MMLLKITLYALLFWSVVFERIPFKTRLHANLLIFSKRYSEYTMLTRNLLNFRGCMSVTVHTPFITYIYTVNMSKER